MFRLALSCLLFSQICSLAYAGQLVSEDANEELLQAIWSGVEEPYDAPDSDWIKDYKKQEEEWMTPTGPIPDGWPFVGVDIEAEMDKLPGGSEKHYLVSDTGGLYFFDGPPEFPPKEWQLLFSSRSAANDTVRRGNLYSLTDKHLLFSGQIDKKIGNAYCWTSAKPPNKNASIFRARSERFDRDNLDDVAAEISALASAHFSLSFATPPMCEVFFRNATGGFTSMIYNMKGEPMAGWISSTKTFKIEPKAQLQPLTTDRKRKRKE